MQTSGYKPGPLDLNHVKLTPNQNTLVERLAENGHNVWARDRVRQGWTYSIVQVSVWEEGFEAKADLDSLHIFMFFV